MSDNVNKPAHYNAGEVETIDGIRAALGEGFADYCKGNVLKYVWRCGKKGDGVEDLRKAATYLQWAIEAMEGNCPVIPDSLNCKSIAIPAGWRELEPDEVPVSTDMHEWMRGWFFRNDDATNEYKWHSSRHIRKIETATPSETPNSSTATEWIPKVGDRVRVKCATPFPKEDRFGVVVKDNVRPREDLFLIKTSNGIFSWFYTSELELIEAANPSEAPSSSTAKPGYFDDVEGVWVDEPDPFEGRKTEPVKGPEYREPTYADLANGPIEVEVCDDNTCETNWKKRMLYAVLPKCCAYPFVVANTSNQLYTNSYIHARIKVQTHIL